MKKAGLYIALIVIGLLMFCLNHVGRSLGDEIFYSLGISPWTGPDQTGFHLSVILGLILLFVGISKTAKYYRPKYPKILSLLIIASIGFISVYPIMTENMLFLIKRNSHTIASIDYLNKDSQCNYQSDEGKIRANCSVTLYNYGPEKEVSIRPILDGHLADFDFEPTALIIAPHTKDMYTIDFYSQQSTDSGTWGSTGPIGIEIELDGMKKLYE